jgi:hypothetical protein
MSVGRSYGSVQNEIFNSGNVEAQKKGLRNRRKAGLGLKKPRSLRLWAWMRPRLPSCKS